MLNGNCSFGTPVVVIPDQRWFALPLAGEFGIVFEQKIANSVPLVESFAFPAQIGHLPLELADKIPVFETVPKVVVEEALQGNLAFVQSSCNAKKFRLSVV